MSGLHTSLPETDGQTQTQQMTKYTAVCSLKMFLTQPMLIKEAMLIWMSGLHILPETTRD